MGRIKPTFLQSDDGKLAEKPKQKTEEEENLAKVDKKTAHIGRPMKPGVSPFATPRGQQQQSDPQPQNTAHHAPQPGRKMNNPNPGGPKYANQIDPTQPVGAGTTAMSSPPRAPGAGGMASSSGKGDEGYKAPASKMRDHLNAP